MFRIVFGVMGIQLILLALYTSFNKTIIGTYSYISLIVIGMIVIHFTDIFNTIKYQNKKYNKDCIPVADFMVLKKISYAYLSIFFLLFLVGVGGLILFWGNDIAKRIYYIIYIPLFMTGMINAYVRVRISELLNNNVQSL